MACRAVDRNGRRVGRLVVYKAACRCSPRHHEQSGPDQYGRSGPVASGDREASDLAGRDRARRNSGDRIHEVDVPQRLLASHCGVHGPHGHILCACAGRGTPDRGASVTAAGDRAAYGADHDRARRNLRVVSSLSARGRKGACPRWTGRVADGRHLSDAGRSTAPQRVRASRLSAHWIGSSARSCATPPALPAWTPSAAT